jgi:hypothetical protein
MKSIKREELEELAYDIGFICGMFLLVVITILLSTSAFYLFIKLIS